VTPEVGWFLALIGIDRLLEIVTDDLASPDVALIAAA
jgi:hypothetical protein